ncbi:cupredoxin domain-containing protein [Candidatus Woesearchaeota archaeon]|nr:cupredoxin domain-containing protein [Candidatus Woesearchaeota archaeon]HIH25899.1 multicopper oxidase domain-containing protein [Nanoarchaeota archaeon]
MKKAIALILILTLLVFGCSKQTTLTDDTQETEIEDVNTGANEVITPGDVKEFTIDGSSYRFSPNILSVNKGDIVRINFVNSEGKHDLKIDGYNIGTKVIDGGQSDVLEFTADKTGEFEYYCSIGEHRQMGMVGKIVVKE